jgi:hypothetical protein
MHFLCLDTGQKEIRSAVVETCESSWERVVIYSVTKIGIIAESEFISQRFLLSFGLLYRMKGVNLNKS